MSWHARQLGREPVEAFAQRYDWGEVQRYYDAGHSVRACCERFGFNRSTWWEAVKSDRLITRPRKPPLCDLLVRGRRVSRQGLKARLVEEGLKALRCDDCGIGGWRGKPIRLDLHHLNGDPLDNRLENPRLLCPNCHSQTPNFAGRSGLGRGRSQRGATGHARSGGRARRRAA